MVYNSYTYSIYFGLIDIPRNTILQILNYNYFFKDKYYYIIRYKKIITKKEPIEYNHNLNSFLFFLPMHFDANLQ